MTAPRTAGKRGRRPARHVPELHIRRFADQAAATTPPETADVTAGITDWGMLGNDRHACCGASAWVHYLMSKAGKTEATIDGQTYQADDPALTEALLTKYFAYGRSEGEPGDQPDEGVENASWLKFLFDQGLFGDDGGYAQVDATNPAEMMWAMVNFGGVLIGAALTDQAETEFENHQPWTVTGTEPIDPNMGHDFLWVAYTPTDGKVVTWGALQGVTIDFAKAEAAAHDLEGWVFVSPEDAERAGVNLDALRAEIARLGGTVHPQPTPDQPPQPVAPSTDPNSPRGNGLPTGIRDRIERLFEEAKAEAHRVLDEVLHDRDQPQAP